VSTLAALGSKEAEMRIIGCDLHASQQTIAMLDRETGEVSEQTLTHEGETVRAFYGALPAPVVVGIEATGSMGWFVRLMEDLRITCRVGHPAMVRKAETRRQKHDRRDAHLLLRLLVEDRFPAIWMPTTELRDLRALLLHRHQWVRMRTRVQNALHAIALGQGLRRGHALWSQDGPAVLASLPLPSHAAHRRTELQALYRHLDSQVDQLDERVSQAAAQRPQATRLMTHPGVGHVTALATEVFLGDPSRFMDGKALASYVGMIPSEYSSGTRQRLGGLSKQGNPLRAFCGARRRCMPCGAIPRCDVFTGGSCHRKASGRRASRRRASSGFASGSCCAIKLGTRSSVAVAQRGSKRGGVRAGMLTWVVVVSDRQTD
jgi:transposase